MRWSGRQGTGGLWALLILLALPVAVTVMVDGVQVMNMHQDIVSAISAASAAASRASSGLASQRSVNDWFRHALIRDLPSNLHVVSIKGGVVSKNPFVVAVSLQATVPLLIPIGRTHTLTITTRISDSS